MRAFLVGAAFAPLRALLFALLAGGLAACSEADEDARVDGRRADASEAAVGDVVSADAASPEPDTQNAEAASASRCTQTEARVQCTYNTLTVDPGGGALPRPVHFQLPSGAAPARGWPAVLLFQGSFFSAELSFAADSAAPFGGYAQAAMVKALLDAGYAVVAPETRGGGVTFWDTNIAPWNFDWVDAPDAHLMTALFSALAQGTFGPVDSSHLFAAGISSGGYMTSRMAVSYSGRFRALAIESASYAVCAGVACAVPSLPSDHPPTLFLHGQLDTVVPVSTMQLYESALRGQGTATRSVVDPAAAHQWINAAPAEVLAWFQAHGG